MQPTISVLTLDKFRKEEHVSRRSWRPTPHERKEERPVVKSQGPIRRTPLALVEWENPQMLSPDVRISRIKDAFRPRGWMLEGEGKEMTGADTRS